MIILIKKIFSYIFITLKFNTVKSQIFLYHRIGYRAEK